MSRGSRLMNRSAPLLAKSSRGSSPVAAIHSTLRAVAEKVRRDLLAPPGNRLASATFRKHVAVHGTSNCFSFRRRHRSRSDGRSQKVIAFFKAAALPGSKPRRASSAAAPMTRTASDQRRPTWRSPKPPTPCCSARSADRNGTACPMRAAGSRPAAAAQGTGLYANLRPAICYPALADASSLKREIVEGLDI